MFQISNKRCYTLGDGMRLQEYLLREHVYVDAAQLNEVGLEEQLRIHKIREELTEAQYQERYVDRIEALEQRLSDIPYHPDINYDQIESVLTGDISKLDNLIKRELTQEETRSFVRHKHRLAILQDIQNCINTCDDMDAFYDKMEALGHSISFPGESMVIDTLDGDFRELRKTNKETIDTFSVFAIERAIEQRIQREDPERVPRLDKYNQAKKYEIKKQMYRAASEFGSYYNPADGHIYKVNMKWQILTNRYGQTSYVKRSHLERLFIKVFMRNYEAEERAHELAANKLSKYQKLQQIEQEKLDSIFELAKNYGIASIDEAKELRKQLTDELIKSQTVQLSIGSRIAKARRMIQEVEKAGRDYDKVEYENLGFKTRSDFKKYVLRFSNPETLIHYEQEKIRILQAQKEIAQEHNAVYRSEIRAITNNFIPYMQSEFLDEVKLRGYKKQYDKAVREKKEADRRDKLYCRDFTIDRPTEEMLQMIEDDKADRADLEAELHKLKAQRNRMVRLEKCDPDLVVCHNISTNDAHDAVREFCENRERHGRDAPTIKSPAKLANGQRARFAQQMIISPAPEDHVTPSQLKDMVSEFYDRSRTLGTDYKSFACIHVDHYTGKDPETGKIYNAERLKRYGPDKNTVHAQIFCDTLSCDNLHFNNDTGQYYSNPIRAWQDGDSAAKYGYDTLKSLQALEYELCLERGWMHSAMHNPVFVQESKQLAQLNLDEIEDRQKLIELAAVAGVYEIKETAPGKYEFSGGHLQEPVTIVASNYKDAVKQFAELQAELTEFRKYQEIIRSETLQAIRNDARSNVSEASEEAGKVFSPAHVTDLNRESAVDTNVTKDTLKEYWIANKGDAAALRDRVRADIDLVMESKHPLNDKEFREEMAKLGYQIYTKRGIDYYTPDRSLSAKEMPRVSSTALDKVDGTTLNRYNRGAMIYEYKQNRERAGQTVKFVSAEQRAEQRKRAGRTGNNRTDDAYIR